MAKENFNTNPKKNTNLHDRRNIGTHKNKGQWHFDSTGPGMGKKKYTQQEIVNLYYNSTKFQTQFGNPPSHNVDGFWLYLCCKITGSYGGESAQSSCWGDCGGSTN